MVSFQSLENMRDFSLIPRQGRAIRTVLAGNDGAVDQIRLDLPRAEANGRHGPGRRCRQRSDSPSQISAHNGFLHAKSTTGISGGDLTAGMSNYSSRSDTPVPEEIHQNDLYCGAEGLREFRL